MLSIENCVNEKNDEKSKLFAYVIFRNVISNVIYVELVQNCTQSVEARLRYG
jgi:hypothetical protein